MQTDAASRRLVSDLHSPRSAGACFGFELDSNLSFSYARAGGGEPLRVVEDEVRFEASEPPLIEWLPEKERHHARLYATPNGYAFWEEGLGWFRVDVPGRVVTVPPSPDRVRREARLWAIPSVLMVVDRGDIALHAAAVEVDGRALLLAAPGKHGKTTLAGAFLRSGYRLLSEDVSCCRVDPDVLVIPGPAALRVRRDVYATLDLPGTYITTEEPFRVHLAIDPSLRGDGSPIPAAAIIFLRRAQKNMRIERAEPNIALRDLWGLHFTLPTDEHRASAFHGVAALANLVPAWNLHRPFVFDDLDVVVDRVLSTCLPR